MACIKDEREDTDDEMEHNSAESDKLSSLCDSTDASDSDDSSGSRNVSTPRFDNYEASFADMDEEECERRRTVCLEALLELERQFDSIREQFVNNRCRLIHSLMSEIRRLYRERIADIKTKLEGLHDGTANEYTEPLEELEENMRIRIEVAVILKKMKFENIEKCFKADDQAAKQNFEEEKTLLFHLIKEDIEERIRRLEEDRNNINFFAGVFNTDKGRNNRTGRGTSSWRKGTKSSDSGRRKPITVSGPYIVYMLSEADIMEDWTIIKKVLSCSKRNHGELHI